MGGKGQGGREPHLGEREKDQSESMERKDSTVNEGRFQGGQARRVSLGDVEGNMS